MAFTQLDTDLNNHQSLGNKPNLNDGLSAVDLKTLYDKAPNDIKSFINTVLLAELASSTVGNCAADKLGIEETILGSGTTLKARAEWLYSQIQGIALGAVPDKSLTEIKFADSLSALQIHYGVDTGVANAYEVTLSPAPTAYTEGMPLAVKIANDSTGASTINVNGLGTKTIKGSDGLDIGAGDLKAGSIYTLRYNGVNFIVQGKGGVTLTGTAVDSHVLLNDTYYNTDAKTKRTGTMVNNGAVVYTPGAADQTVAEGYHNGLGKVKGEPNLGNPANWLQGVTMYGTEGTAISGKGFASGSGNLDINGKLIVTGLTFNPAMVEVKITSGGNTWILDNIRSTTTSYLLGATTTKTGNVLGAGTFTLATTGTSDAITWRAWEG